MKILFTANYNPHFVSTSVYREKAMESLGHEVTSFETRAFLIPGRIRENVKFLQTWDLKRINENLIKVAETKKPDLCIVAGGYLVLSDTLVRLKSMGIKLILRTTNVPVDFSNIIETAPFYDHIFCAGTEAVEILRGRWAEKVSWVPYACDPDYHKLVELTDAEIEKYARNIAFVGSYYPNRAKVLESICDMDLGVWGPNWSKLDQKSPLTGKTANARLNYTEWVRIFCASDITLLVHYDDGKTLSNQASPRVYEAMACKSFVLSDRQKDVVTLFEDKKHLVFFSDEKDLREKIQYYLNHPEERRRIAEEGYKEVVMKHTYRHRFEKMLSIVQPGQ